MKILDRYIFTTYFQRLLVVFVILILIFFIQTLWLFIDELAGKGLDFYIVLKFLVFYSPKLIPLVLPLSVLLASLMTFGNFAENYELAAMKSTGVSLQRALRSLVIFHFLLGIGSFYFSDIVIPWGEYKYLNLRKNLAELKPSLAITEGVFNNLGEFNIKVSRKYGENEKFLDDVIIHEKSEDAKNRVVIKAKSGELKSASFDQQLQLILFDGNRYEEIKTNSIIKRGTYPHAKVNFKKYVMNIDLSSFNNVDLNKENYTDLYRMQNVSELTTSIDSLEKNYKLNQEKFAENLTKINTKSLVKKSTHKTVDSIYAQYSSPLEYLFKEKTPIQQLHIFSNAINILSNSTRSIENKKKVFSVYQRIINLHKITFYERYNLGFGIFLLFIIGSTLGAIIKKGGLGLPIVLAIIIFLAYYYIGFFGRNTAKDASMSTETGSWLAILFYTPIAILFIRQATRDRKLINLDFAYILVAKLMQHFPKRKSNKANV